jgi:hypothetical protein
MPDRETPSRNQHKPAVTVDMTAPAPAVQPKLAIGRADDPAEVEADRLAEEVMRLLAHGGPANADEVVAEDAEGVARVRRAAGPVTDRLGGTLAVADVEARIQSRRGRGQPIDGTVADTLGAAFGADFSRVRLHTDGAADELSRALDAKAFTVGSDIFFRSDERASARRPNALLAHELTHVVQQGGAGPIQRDIVRRATPPADMAAAVAAKAIAMKDQDDSRKQLKAWVEDGAKNGADLRLRNSCEAVLNGRVKLYALTLTGDSAARVTQKGEDPSDTGAWIPNNLGAGRGDIMSPSVTYNHADLDDNTDVKFAALDSVAAALNGKVAIYKVLSQTKAYVFETLRHEIQHVLDRSDDKKTAAGGAGAKFALERYKTEYRAYSYEGSDNDNYSPTKKVTAEGFTWTERQRHIFEHVYAGYAHTKDNWDANPVIDGKSFREHVVAYVDPDSEGFNKNNSVRVDALYEAVKKCPDNSNKIDAPLVKDVIAKITQLTPQDAKVVAKDNNADWRKLIEKKFGLFVRNKIFAQINELAA